MTIFLYFSRFSVIKTLFPFSGLDVIRLFRRYSHFFRRNSLIFQFRCYSFRRYSRWTFRRYSLNVIPSSSVSCGGEDTHPWSATKAGNPMLTLLCYYLLNIILVTYLYCFSCSNDWRGLFNLTSISPLYCLHW